MKCRKCGDRAVLELRRHNAAFCAPDFLEFFRKQVAEAIRRTGCSRATRRCWSPCRAARTRSRSGTC